MAETFEILDSQNRDNRMSCLLPTNLVQLNYTIMDVTWITTRDGSPTLWDNTRGEPFRSTYGAFTESWEVFVKPSLERIKILNKKHFVVGELGLGPGTNWLLFSLAARYHQIDFTYFVIEQDLTFFRLGIEKWNSSLPLIQNFLLKQGINVTHEDILSALNMKPLIFQNPESAYSTFTNQTSIWFHDPFGIDVNEEAYQVEFLKVLSQLWDKDFFAFTYACNKVFQRNLLQLDNIKCLQIENPKEFMKRFRLTFFS